MSPNSKLEGNCRTNIEIMNLYPNKINKHFYKNSYSTMSNDHLRHQTFFQKSDDFWFPRSENCKDALKLMAGEKKIHESLMNFRVGEQLHSTLNDSNRKKVSTL